MTSQLSDRVKELIAKSRIVSFASWEQSYPKEVIQLFQTADDEGRYLTDEDLEEIGAVSPDRASLLNIARFLRDRVSEIVVEAREQVLLAYPDITQPGGSLYPPERAEACWRDFWHFLRCITYGIAGGKTDFISSEGLDYMNLLYQELQVPLAAMVLGLENLKSASLRRLPDNEGDSLTPYFDRLINQLRTFS